MHSIPADHHYQPTHFYTGNGDIQGQSAWIAPLWDKSKQAQPAGNVGNSFAVPDYWQSLVTPINDEQTSAPLVDISYDMNVAVGMTHKPTAADLLDANQADKIGPDRHSCTWRGCNSSFSRKADRDRHITTKHRNVRYHHCRVAGCPKSCGSNALRAWKGYSRIDKLQEHMRKKHAGSDGFSTNAH
jgi:hypothetical protein